MTQTTNERLINSLDDFAEELLKEARGHISSDDGQDDAPRIGFVDKLKTFGEVAKWVATRNKIDPDEQLDEFAKARKQFVGGARRGRATGPAGNA